jgi:hypothetical protein
MRGLGDLVELLAGLLGAKPDPECGCQHRRELLNKMFPFPHRLRAILPAAPRRG